MDDQDLRNRRLVFYKADMEKIHAVLNEFLNLSHAICTLLVDKDGHLITQAGQTSSYNADTISALVAGSFAATREMARILGEEEFSILFHQGRRENIQLALVEDRCLVAIVFDESTTLGLVRLYCSDMVDKLARIFRDSRLRGPNANETLSESFTKSISQVLDDTFGPSQ